MLKVARDYAKAVWTNKYALASNVAFWGAICVQYFRVDDSNALDAAVVSLFVGGVYGHALTGLALPTFNSYRRVSEHIKKWGTVVDNFHNKYNEDYCTRVGMVAAMKEAGLESRL